jgi:hypothetical protein
MPGVVKGTHAFRPSQQTVGAIANAPYPSTSTSNPGSMQPLQTPLLTRSGLEELNSSGDEDPQPPPTLYNAPSSANSSSTKCKNSAVGDSGDGSIRSSAVVSTVSKKQHVVTGAVALNGIKDGMILLRNPVSMETPPKKAE